MHIMNRSWLWAVIAIALVAVGCTAPTQAPRPSGDGPAKSGGALHIRNTADMTDWNMRVNGQNRNNVNGIVMAYESLLGFKQTPLPDINYFDTTLMPKLAEKWEVSPDAKTFTFHLRKGVKFADGAPVNGRDLTSADVKWSFEYTSSTGQFKDLPESQNSFMWGGLAAMDTPDPQKVVIRFQDSFAPFISYAATAFNPVYPKELLAVNGEFTTNILGSGPFQYDKDLSQKGTRWVFKKNPTYWNASSVYLDEVRVLVLPEDAAAQAAFRTQQLDVITSANGPIIKDLAATNPNAHRLDRAGTPRYVLMHAEKPPLNNPKVRQAISRAIDRDEFLKILGGGTWGLAGSNTWVDLFTDDEVRKIYKYDVNEAKKLLSEAGYANGAKVELLTDLGTDAERTLAQLLQAQLKKAGIDLVFDQRTPSEVSNDRKKGLFQMHWFSEYPRPDPDYSLYGYYGPGERLNYTMVNDPKVTQLITAQRREPDPAKRREIMREAIRYINENAVGIAIDRGPNAVFWHPYVKNYTPHFDADILSLNAWLDK